MKQKQEDSVDNFKARFVAKDFEQQSDIDQNETFSHIIKPATIHVLLSLAVHFDWPIHHLDISNAFLYDVIGEDVYMEQPQRFVDKSFLYYVCKL